MDKIVRYQRTITALLTEIASKPYFNAPGIERQVVVDFSNHHYLLINLGWHRGRFVYNTLLHFDIQEGRIWVQQNGTEIEIADELIARGVSPSDIILGFVPEAERGLVKFAVAG